MVVKPINHLTVRADGRIEVVCNHGVGHSHPVSVKHMGEVAGIHCCDGCCRDEHFFDEENLTAVSQSTLEYFHAILSRYSDK